MANSESLKSMVMSFRVSELQVLLGFGGRSKAGKKHELMSRALNLTDHCSTPIQMKIKELYKRRFPSGLPSAKSANSSNSPPKSASSPHRHSPYPGSVSSAQPPGGASALSPGSMKTRKGTGSSPARADYTNTNHSQIPIHPDVSFKRLPFFDILAQLLKPSSLVPKNTSRFQETTFIFHLTPQQAREIAMSRDLRPGSRDEYSVQIQLRFCLLETSCQQKDEFPPSICVRVNNKVASLPNPIPTNKPGVEPKRPSRAVNITNVCRISPTISNQIIISWASELGRNYCVCVDLVRKLNADILLNRLKQKGSKHSDHTRALIKEKLAHDPDSEIATTSLRISLLCPLGKMKMSQPSRAQTCNHLQCFDAPTFLQMNEKKPTWQCPVCDRAAEFDNLIIDGLFTEIVNSAADATEIQFTEDGSWQPLKPKEKGRSTPEPITTISCDNGDDSVIAITDASGTSHTESKKNVDVIDLTASDDEDDCIQETSPTSPVSSDSCPSVISTKPPECKPSPNKPEQQRKGCVSPPLISIDSPGHPSYTPIHSPPSLSSYSPKSIMSRSPQSVTPLSGPRSPYASSQPSHSPRRVVPSPPPPVLTRTPPPLSSPYNFSQVLPPALGAPFVFPPYSTSTSQYFAPPPAHSNPSKSAAHFPLFQSLYTSDAMGDSDFETLLGYMAGEYHQHLQQQRERLSSPSPSSSADNYPSTSSGKTSKKSSSSKPYSLNYPSYGIPGLSSGLPASIFSQSTAATYDAGSYGLPPLPSLEHELTPGGRKSVELVSNLDDTPANLGFSLPSLNREVSTPSPKRRKDEKLTDIDDSFMSTP